MSAHDDPIRRAIASGDTACPDGQALARLGELVRAAARPPGEVDLVHAAQERIAAESGIETADDAIDAVIEHGARPDPAFARLGDLVRGACAPERQPDLVAAMRRRLAGSSRRLTMAPVRNDGGWRVLKAVVAGHLAALVLLTLWTTGDNDEGGDRVTASRPDGEMLGVGGNGKTSRIPTELPADWRAIAESDLDLMALRRDARARDEARRHFAMDASADAVAGCLAWLQARQDPASGAILPLTGDLDRDLAVQALAALALCGEGTGTSPIDVARGRSLARILDWLVENAGAQRRLTGHDEVAAGLATLALVEGAALTDDARLRAAAGEALATIDGLSVEAGASGLGGFTLLAIETAVLGDLPVPGRAREQAQHIGRGLPNAGDDAGRLGLALFARSIYGKAGASGGAQMLSALAEHLPIADQDGQVNPLQWFFATLALREAGGGAWERWSRQLQYSLREALAVAEDGTAWLPASRTRHADAAGEAGDVFATSLLTLNLQAAYRYLPLAPAR